MNYYAALAKNVSAVLRTYLFDFGKINKRLVLILTT